MSGSLFVDQNNSALLTDLYELTMAAGYWSNQVTDPATFELYFRRLPRNRSYILAAGLEQALDYICNLRFSSDQIEWLRSLEPLKKVDSGFFNYLSNFRFSGDVWALPEGTPVFPLEPMLQVRAPLIEAQILETYLLSMLTMQSMVATKASRMVQAAKGRGVVDFGTRRAHGPQAGLLAARASYIGGCIGTSNVLAGRLAGIPLYGTAAHSFTMAFPSELEAFRAYYRVFPDSTVLLIDTYDTLAAARKVKSVGAEVFGVRIDSGDPLYFSREVRKILDQDGLHSVKILVSGDLNEYKIDHLASQNAPIDLFGVGTELVTSYDDPALSTVYKIVESTIVGNAIPTIKISPGKISYPGQKQIYRFSQNSFYSHDIVSLTREAPPSGGVPLLNLYIQGGKVVKELPSITQLRSASSEELKHLPVAFHRLSETTEHPVVFSDGVRNELHKLEANLRKQRE